jgi:hypothetical protein
MEVANKDDVEDSMAQSDTSVADDVRGIGRVLRCADACRDVDFFIRTQRETLA